MEMLYVILVAALIIFWLVAVDRPILVVTFKDGQLTNNKGLFPQGFKHNLLDIAQHEPFSGQLKIYQQRTGVKLTFSKQVPKKIQQRIRNVFPHQGFTHQQSKRKKSS